MPKILYPVYIEEIGGNGKYAFDVIYQLTYNNITRLFYLDR